MRKAVSAFAIAGTACTFAIYALFNDISPSATSFLQSTGREHEFVSFVSKYGRSFGTKEEYNFRLKVFLENLEKIDAHNALGSTSTVGVNHLVDWTDEE